MGALYKKADFIAFTDYIHPEVLISMGGKDIMLKMLNTGLDPDTKVESYLIQAPVEIINDDDSTLQCSMVQTMVVSTPVNKISAKSSLIGIS